MVGLLGSLECAIVPSGLMRFAMMAIQCPVGAVEIWCLAIYGLAGGISFVCMIPVKDGSIFEALISPDGHDPCKGVMFLCVELECLPVWPLNPYLAPILTSPVLLSEASTPTRPYGHISAHPA